MTQCGQSMPNISSRREAVNQCPEPKITAPQQLAPTYLPICFHFLLHEINMQLSKGCSLLNEAVHSIWTLFSFLIVSEGNCATHWFIIVIELRNLTDLSFGEQLITTLQPYFLMAHVRSGK